MKKNFRIIALIVCSLMLCMSLNAQIKAKYAHLNSSELMEVMPGRDSAEKVIKDLTTKLESEFKDMYDEYQNKVTKFQNEQATMSQAMQQTKMQELGDLKKRIESFQEQANSELEEKREVLLKPLIDKAKEAINKVAKANGYTYVFDSGTGMLLYFEDGNDIIDLVKKELGIN